MDGYGQKTKRVQDALDSVPTIVFNDKFNADDSKEAYGNFLAALCKRIDHDKPEECQKAGAGDLTKPLGITLLALILALSRVL